MLGTILIASLLTLTPQAAPGPNAPQAAKPAAAPTSAPPPRDSTTTVMEVGSRAKQIAAAVVEALQGRVTATAVGDSLLLTGPQDSLAAASELVLRLKVSLEDQEQRDREREEKFRMDRADRDRREADREEMFNLQQRKIDTLLGPTLGDSLKTLSGKLAEGTGEQEAINVVYVDPSLAAIPVPRTELHGVRMYAVLNTLRALVGGKASISEEAGERGGGIRPSHQVVIVRPVAAPNSRSSEAAPEIAVFRIDPVADWMDDLQKKETIAAQDNALAAIDTGLDLMGRSKEFKIRLHRETGMLFVYGTGRELRLVAQVVGGDSPSAAPTPSPVAEAPAATPPPAPAAEDPMAGAAPRARESGSPSSPAGPSRARQRLPNGSQGGTPAPAAPAAPSSPAPPAGPAAQE